MAKNLNNNYLLTIYTDGASRGNPGPSAWAYVFVINNKIIYQQSGYIKLGTNNQAEYQAIIEALIVAKNHPQERITVYSDSELVIKQLNNEYKIKKPHLQELFQKVKQLSKSLSSVSFIHVSRSNQWLKKADALCNQTLDANKTKP